MKYAKSCSGFMRPCWLKRIAAAMLMTAAIALYFSDVS